MQRELTNLYDVIIRDFDHHKLEMKNIYTEKGPLDAIKMVLDNSVIYKKDNIKSVYARRQTRRTENA